MTLTPWVPDCYPPTHRSDHVDVHQSAFKGEQLPDPFLQHNVPNNPNPLLLRVDKSWLGHGYGKTTEKV